MPDSPQFVYTAYMASTLLRDRLREKHGGKCQRCGYSRCRAALHFHHKDASEKAKYSGGRGLASAAEIQAYPERFVLLCANCHIETHVSQAEQERIYKPCLICGTMFYRPECRASRYCSRKCYHASRLCSGSKEAETKRRFLALTEAAGECLLWKGGGVFVVTDESGKHSRYRYRPYAYKLFRGDIPAGMKLFPTCGKENCINPEHLQLATTNQAVSPHSTKRTRD